MAELNLPAGQHGTQDDIATLYAWANMRGAKYRDFSASRSEARVAAKRRVEEAEEVARLKVLEEEERAAQEEAQRAAREAAEQAELLRRAEAERLAEIARQGEAERQAVLAAQEAQRKSLMHRLSHLGQQAEQRAEQEAEMRAEQRAEQQPGAQRAGKGPGLQRGPERRQSVLPPPVSYPDDPWGGEDVDNGGAGKSEDHGIPAHGVGQPFSMEEKSYGGHIGNDPVARERADRLADRHFDARPSQPQSHPPSQPDQSAGRERQIASAESYGERSFSGQYPSQPAPDEMPMPGLDAPILPSWLAELPRGGGVAQTPAHAPRPPQRPVMVRRVEATAEIPHQHPFERSSPPVYSAEPAGQEWESSGYGSTAFPVHGDFRPQRLVNQAPETHAQAIQAPAARAHTTQAQSSVEDPLLASRERITRGWFALKSVFHPDQVASEMQQPQAPGRTPVMALFSLAGGVGKTSLLASLGRALSARGERVLLVDLAAYGLLPFFFGARDQRPGQLRTFSPPGSTGDAPIQMITLDPETHKQETQKGEPAGGADGLIQEVMHHAHEASRILMDLPTASGATMRRVLRMNPTVLVPVVPDMNSVVSVGAIESFFQNQIASAHAQAQPVYILNQFDSSQQLHLDVREILREQIGNRLLPFALRRSPSVSEALAEGMTVMDYAQSSVIAEDFLNLANWVRSLSAPAAVAQRGVRWSER